MTACKCLFDNFFKRRVGRDQIKVRDRRFTGHRRNDDITDIKSGITIKVANCRAVHGIILFAICGHFGCIGLLVGVNQQRALSSSGKVDSKICR